MEDHPNVMIQKKRGSFAPLGGADGIRTHDFYLAKVALSQLSYGPSDCNYRTTIQTMQAV